jgi:hypothetical protein
MMPPALIYALSDDRQRAALNAAHAARATARAASVTPVEVSRPRRRRAIQRQHRFRECPS